MQIIRQGQSLLPLSDRAVAYGDGFFTTVLVIKGQLQLWPLHFKRLQNAASRLSIHIDDWQALDQQTQDFAVNVDIGVCKVLVSRGSGGRGYSPENAGPPVAMLSLHQVPGHYAHWAKEGVNLGLSDVRLARQPLLGGIKHLNRLEQVLVKQAMCANSSPTLDDVITLDTEGFVIESSSANLLWFKQGHWFSPSTVYAGIDGVFKQHIAAHLEANDSPVTYGEFPLVRLLEADSVLMCNSLMQIIPVNRVTLDGHHYPFDMQPVLDLREQVVAC